MLIDKVKEKKLKRNFGRKLLSTKCTWCDRILGTRMTLYSLNMLPDERSLLAELATALIPFSFHD
ncbi:16529_t:CDS:2 [Entrophospora sp. SA101]|nr:16529_t:CDS:2 [Entrophospora sp. SA101]CAJ0864039.1 2650_t:CDS:2 [Entrophospora sp. SA101]